MATDHAQSAPTNRLFAWVWLWLLLLTIVEVVFAYQHLTLAMMIVILLGLSLMKSALIMAYFMHLRFERLSLVLTIIPVLVILICLMFISFPDSVRIHQLTPK